MNILSIDWDYFFPNVDEYDWGHSESNPLFFEQVWPTRADCLGFLNRKVAFDHVRPRINEIHQLLRRLDTSNVQQLVLAESHKTLLDYVGTNRHLHVTNIDAHHDWHYGTVTEPNCGNWAGWLEHLGQLKTYRLFYPEWSKEIAEFREACDCPWGSSRKVQVNYGLPPAQHLQPDLIFACRSSCWTPSWADDQWMDLSTNLQAKTLGCKFDACRFVLKPREFNEAMRTQMRAVREQMEKTLI